MMGQHKNARSFGALGLSAALLTTLPGCAALPGMREWVKVRPVQQEADAGLARNAHEAAYAGATAAIGRRDYARALELLQQARTSKADDVKTLNAFGVVYDKLGRFDLSARYYAQARALDPSSAIITQNIAYSTQIQTRASQQTFAQMAPEPERPIQSQRSPGPVVRLGFADNATIKLGNGLTGRALEIADASGGPAGVPVRQALVRLGWSVEAQEHRVTHPQSSSSITYPTHQIVAARALERTLPGGVRMIDCGENCHGIRLALGSDALTWFAAPRGSRRDPERKAG